MKKATIRIRRDAEAALKDMGERFVRAWKTGESGGDTLEFESPAALFRLLSPKRWEASRLTGFRGGWGTIGTGRPYGEWTTPPEERHARATISGSLHT